MWNSMKKSLGSLDREHLLEMLGLEQRRSIAARALPALALLGTGVVLGVGVGLMVAPRSGRELRHDLRSRVGKGSRKVTIEEVAESAGPWPSAPRSNAPRPSAPHS